MCVCAYVCVCMLICMYMRWSGDVCVCACVCACAKFISESVLSTSSCKSRWTLPSYKYPLPILLSHRLLFDPILTHLYYCLFLPIHHFSWLLRDCFTILFFSSLHYITLHDITGCEFARWLWSAPQPVVPCASWTWRYEHIRSHRLIRSLHSTLVY